MSKRHVRSYSFHTRCEECWRQALLMPQGRHRQSIHNTALSILRHPQLKGQLCIDVRGRWQKAQIVCSSMVSSTLSVSVRMIRKLDVTFERSKARLNLDSLQCHKFPPGSSPSS